MDSRFTELVSVDGRITPTAEATIPLKDDGLYRGDGVFEVIRLYAGRPFALADHYQRMQRSADAIELPLDRPALEVEVEALLAQAGAVEAQLRLIATRGGRRIAATEPVPEHAAAVAVASVVYQPTVILNGVKSLSYGANMHATRLAKTGGADEAVLVRPDGTVLEPPTSSIFWVSEGELRTTALAGGVLASITRDRLVAALEVSEGEWPLTDLLGAAEAFLASTVREVQPVRTVDGNELGEVPGPRTLAAREAFAATLARELGDA
jgi:branched-chain amino acid aminotransferase